MHEHDFPDALVHQYMPTSPGESVPLYDGDFKFAGDDEGRTWFGRAALIWYPSPHVLSSASSPSRDVTDFMDIRASGKREWVEMPSIEVPLKDGVLPAQPVGPTTQPMDSGRRRTDRLAPQVIGDGSAIDRLTFLVPNGWDTPLGSGVADPADLRRYWHGRLEAFPTGWHITIDRRPEVNRKFWARLRDENASAVTHIGQIARDDGSSFDAEDAEPVLQALRLAFSLAVGRTVTPLLPVGWRGRHAVWARWGGAHIDRVLNTGHFLDRQDGVEQLRELIERVVDYCRVPERLDVLQYATSYYVTATYDVDVELGVALPVSGMQLLAYNRFVEQRRSHTKKQWKALPATENEIRLLLDDCKIPTGIPATHGYLRGVSRKAQSSEQAPTPRDALGCVMLLRNKIIHPTSTKPGTWSAYEWSEAGDYAAHCLLLAILNTVGYQGRHRSAWAENIWEGVTEPVPWAATP